MFAIDRVEPLGRNFEYEGDNRRHRLKRERDLDASAFGAFNIERAVDTFD